MRKVILATVIAFSASSACIATAAQFQCDAQEIQVENNHLKVEQSTDLGKAMIFDKGEDGISILHGGSLKRVDSLVTKKHDIQFGTNEDGVTFARVKDAYLTQAEDKLVVYSNCHPLKR